MNAHAHALNGIGPAGSHSVRAIVEARSIRPFKASEALERFICYFAPMVEARAEAPQTFEALVTMATDAGFYADLLKLADLRSPLRLHKLAALANRQTSPFIVWDGGCDSTIYSSPRVNHAFRALHDAYHLILSEPFTDAGERAVCAALNSDLAYYVDIEDIATLHAETVGQLEYQAAQGRFPDDQARFVAAYLDDAAHAVRLPF